MREYRSVVLQSVAVIFIGVPLFLGCGGVNVKDRLEVTENRQEKAATELAAEEKIILSVDMPKNPSLGESITAEFRLQNRSPSAIAIIPPMEAAFEFRQIHVDVKGEDGEGIERTALGNGVFRQSESITSGPSSQVAPSASRVWKLDVQPLFQFKRGKYTVTASVAIVKNDDGKAKAESIESKPTEINVK